MSDEFKTEINSFISRSMDYIKRGRGEAIEGTFYEDRIRVKIRIYKEDENEQY